MRSFGTSSLAVALKMLRIGPLRKFRARVAFSSISRRVVRAIRSVSRRAGRLRC